MFTGNRREAHPWVLPLGVPAGDQWINHPTPDVRIEILKFIMGENSMAKAHKVRDIEFISALIRGGEKEK